MLIDTSLTSDIIYFWGYFLSTFSFMFGALVYLSLNPIGKDYLAFFNRDIEQDSSPNMYKVMFVFLLSILVTISYYRVVGTNLFLTAALGIAIEDFTTSRLAAYSSDTYFAPGYVNQFKNVLLPLTTSILGALFYLQGSKVKFRLLVIAAALFLPFALLGTGQRAFLAYSFAAFIFGLVCITDIKPRQVIIPGIIIFGLFSFMTFLYKNYQFEDGNNVFVMSVLKTFERFFYTEQYDTLISFRELFQRDIVFFYEWYEQLRGLVPGQSGSYLQHEMFAMVHGTDRGTLAISTVASVIYNGGIVMVTVAYLLFGYINLMIYHRFLRGRRSIIRVFSYGALFFYLATFVTGGPSTFVNKGGLAILLFLIIRNLMFNSPKFQKAKSL